MKISSPWKITWDPDGTPLVIVEFDQKIDDEIRFPARQKLITREVIEAEDTDFLPRDLWAQSLEMKVYKTHATDTAARLWMPTHVALLSAVGRKDLKVEWDDGAEGTEFLLIPNACLEDVDPRRDPTVPLGTETKYTFRGARMRLPA